MSGRRVSPLTNSGGPLHRTTLGLPLQLRSCSRSSLVDSKDLPHRGHLCCSPFMFMIPSPPTAGKTHLAPDETDTGESSTTMRQTLYLAAGIGVVFAALRFGVIPIQDLLD